MKGIRKRVHNELIIAKIKQLIRGIQDAFALNNSYFSFAILFTLLKKFKGATQKAIIFSKIGQYNQVWEKINF